MDEIPKNLSTLLWRSSVFLMLSLGCVAGIGIWFLHFDYEMNWQRYYGSFEGFGDQCQAATGKWTSGASFEQILNQPHHTIKFDVPYRGKNDPPPMGRDGYLYVHCLADFSHLRPSGFAHVSLGPVFGATAVFLNGRLVYETSDDGDAEFFLPPADREKIADVVIISRNTAEGRPGLASLVPITVTDQRQDIHKLNRLQSSWSLEQPVFRIGYALGLLLLFSVAWLMRVRTVDVSWIIVLTVALLFRDALTYELVGEKLGAVQDALVSTVNFLIALSLAAFILRFGRVKVKLMLLEIGVPILTVLYAILVFALDPMVFFNLRLRDQFPSLLATVLIVVAAVIAARNAVTQAEVEKNKTTRLFYFLGMCGFAFVLYASQAIWSQESGVLLAPFGNYFLVTIFAVCLMIDVLLYQEEYFKERELRVTEQRRAKIDRAVANYTRMLAHDVRGPLRLALSYFRALRDASRDQTMIALVDQLSTRFGKAVLSVESMLSDVMNSGANSIVQAEPVSLKSLVSRSVLDISGLWPHANVRVNYQFQHQAKLRANGQRLERVVFNLLENALQAMKGEGKITFRTSERLVRNHRMVELAIRNSDSFIEPEKLEKIFEPFFTEGKPRGTGLGLAIVKDIVEAHGGEVWCKSDVTEGTEFGFLIPADEGTNDHESYLFPERIGSTSAFLNQEKHEVDPGTALPRLAVIDDNIFVLESWKKQVRDADVHIFQSPTEFLLKWRSKSIDPNQFRLIITDLSFMNDREHDGESFARELKENGVVCKIVVMSNATEELLEGLDHFDGYIEKRPYALAELASAYGLGV